METPDSDWFPSRVDLRRAWRWERMRWAVAGNLVFLAWACICGWFGSPPHAGFIAFFLLSGIGVAFTTLFHSFVRTARREQLEDFARRQGRVGCHVTCRFYEGDFEIGSDFGYLAREGGMLRFEGTTSRFALAASSLVSQPDLKARNPDLHLEAMRIRIKPDRDPDADDTSVILNRWLQTGGSVGEEHLPPRTPQARSWGWYFERAGEQHQIALSFTLFVSMFLKMLVPESLKWLRFLIIGLPVPCLLLIIIRTAFRLRRDDEAWLAQRAATLEALPSATNLVVETPLKVTAS